MLAKIQKNLLSWPETSGELYYIQRVTGKAVPFGK